MKFLMLIVGCIAIYFGFKTNLLLGIIISVLVIINVLVKFIPFMFKNKSRRLFSDGEYKNAVAYYEKALKYSSNNFDAKM